MKRVVTILGGILILFGLFFALQGANIIHWPLESTMLGRGVWIRNGLIIAALGAVLIAAVRRRRF
jgi:hypothetical protein